MKKIKFHESEDENGERKCRILYAKFQKSSEPPFIILFLVKNHIVKNEANARRLVLAAILIFFLLSALLFIKAFSGLIIID